jgi:hypothetical protein
MRISIRSVLQFAMALAAVSVATPAAGGILVADSVAEFSSTQGQSGWYYGYHNVSVNGTYDATPGGTDDFLQLSWCGLNTNHADSNAWQWNVSTAPWTYLSADETHPNGTDQWSGGSTNVHWSVRRWVSDVTGTLEVHWHLAKPTSAVGGNPWSNGSTGRVLLNGVEANSRTIAWNDTTGVDVVTTIDGVQPGDFLDFALDATGTFSSLYGGYGNGQWDATTFTATVFVPEPATLSLLALGGLVLARRSRRP